MTMVATRLVVFRLAFLFFFPLLLSGCSPLGRANVVINESADAALTTTVKRDLFFTKARIGAREAGLFLIDTGVSDLFFDVELAKALNLSLWGKDVHRETKQPIRFGTLASLEIGPMVLQNPRMAVLNLSSLTPVFGERLAGLLGYPFFAKAVIEVNYPKQSISCFDPKHYRLPWGEWQPLTLKTNRPALTAHLEGHIEGLFMLDTGSTSTVHFFPGFIEKHALLDHRDVKKATRSRVGGAYEILVGKIAWFELAGRRFEKPTVGFRLPNRPESEGTEGFAGVIGHGFMREFIVVFNYPESKVALLRQ